MHMPAENNDYFKDIESLSPFFVFYDIDILICYDHKLAFLSNEEVPTDPIINFRHIKFM